MSSPNGILPKPNDYIVKGDVHSLQSDYHFSNYIFNTIKAQDQSKIVIIDYETGHETTLGYVHDKIIKTSIALKKYLQPGDVVASVCDNEPISLYSTFATIYAGLPLVLVNPSYNTRELIHNFNLTCPKLVFCSSSSLSNVLEARDSVGSIEFVIVLSEEPVDGNKTILQFMEENVEDVKNFKPAPYGGKDDTAIVVSSSGTTGLPKGVMLSYKNLYAMMPFVIEKRYFDINKDNVIIQLLPIFHIFGFFVCHITLTIGGKMVWLRKYKPTSFLDAIQKYKVNKLYIVPPLATFLAKHPTVDGYDLTSVKDIVCGAAALSQNIIELIKKRLGVTTRQAYGLSEALVLTISPNGTDRSSSCGKLTPNMEVVVRDLETGKILPKTSTGEICVKSPCVMKGYMRNREATEASFDEDGYLKTGDVGYFDEDDFIYIVDRCKEMIKCKAFQIAPSELEDILYSHNGVKEVTVVGVSDERYGELPVAFVVKQNGSDVTAEELTEFVNDKVSISKKLVGGVKFIDELPKTQSGKVLKRILKEMAINY